MNTHLWPHSKAGAESAEPKSAFLSNELPGATDAADLGPHFEGQGQGTASPPRALTCINTPETPMAQNLCGWQFANSYQVSTGILPLT